MQRFIYETGVPRAVTGADERGTSAIETLRSARVESRLVLDHRIDLLDEIDEKALRTVRASMVVLALVVSAAQIAGPTQTISIHPISAASVGIAGLLFSIVFGTAIYSVSQIPYGIGPGHRTEAVDGEYSEREWLVLLLDEYDGWTAEIRALAENNARWLLYVQASFVAGVMLVVASFVDSLSSISFQRGPLLLGCLAAGLMAVRNERRSTKR